MLVTNETAGSDTDIEPGHSQALVWTKGVHLNHVEDRNRALYQELFGLCDTVRMFLHVDFFREELHHGSTLFVSVVVSWFVFHLQLHLQLHRLAGKNRAETFRAVLPERGLCSQFHFVFSSCPCK